MTSIKDDSVGGDTNQDGNSTSPGAGDWGMIDIQGYAEFEHAEMRYGAGTSGGYNYTGTIRTTHGATVTVSKSVIREAFYEGITTPAGGDVTITNSIITGTDRAVNSDFNAIVRLINCTLDDNRFGIWGHGGETEIVNT